MLTQSRVTTVLPVVDVGRARRFYEERLGLAAGQAKPDGSVVYHVGSSEILLSPHKEPTKSEYTAASFEVDDIVREVKDLETRGVAFEDYDLPELKTYGHIAAFGSEKAAWFKDPEGNILCIHEDAARRPH
jgi:catechol 2,3-dioxygenase-like lactoylglutathione lyase family enzyme